MTIARAFRTKLEAIVSIFAGALGVVLLVQEVPRILFPWDLRMWCESPLLTDMMKLSAGQPPYTSPGDSNSSIYAPGLDYVTYALLRPLGAQLDVRACRAVTVALGVAAALLAGAVVARLVAQLTNAPQRGAVRVVASLAAMLVVFKSFTADACHPDNLYALHAMLSIALTYAAIESESVRAGVVAVTVAALGVLAKQTGILGFFGTTSVVLFFCARRWGAARSLAVVAAGGAVLGGSLWVVLHGFGRYWTVDLPGRQSVELFRAMRLITFVVGVPHRALLYALFAPSVAYLTMRGGDRTNKLLFAWGAVGVTEAVPSLLSYFKILGHWNNLIIIDLWASVPVLAVLASVVSAPREEHGAPLRAALGGTLVTLLLTLFPMRSMPTPRQYAYGRSLDRELAADSAAGKRVLVSHGCSALIHAGLVSPPLDRSYPTVERWVADLLDFDETNARIAAGSYDVIYLLGGETPAYPSEILTVIFAHYHDVRHIDGDGSQALDSDFLGFQGIMRDGVRILERNP